MYLDRAIAEDKHMVERWEGDADGMLIFVGLPTTSHTSGYDLEIIDWSILCCSRGIARSVRPEYSAKPAGHLSVLSCAYLSARFYATKRVPSSHPVELVRPQRTIHSTYAERLGQRALVLEPDHQSDLCHVGDIAAAVGASLS